VRILVYGKISLLNLGVVPFLPPPKTTILQNAQTNDVSNQIIAMKCLIVEGFVRSVSHRPPEFCLNIFPSCFSALPD
ncbi:hypothetical protein, partial [Alicyclobacillus suci]|uniref:hypothetical protein n=1 Tax=Alicyclobacillus suci TaxID=2816080 RepID=UPI001A8F07D9